MIVTLTPNPSVDRTVEVAGLDRGAVLRARSSRVDPGGKGLNVARALMQHGVPATAVLPLGGRSGADMSTLLDAGAVPTRRVPIALPIRSNIAIVEGDGTTTKINESGPRLEQAEVDALIAAAARETGPGDWLVCCGSLPPGAPSSLYADLVATARARGALVGVDSSGEAMRLAIEAGPDLIKPNRVELGGVVGRDLGTVREVVEAARALPVGEALISLGRDGALLVTAEGVWLAQAAPVTPVSTVGAGDSLLAGYLVGRVAGDTPPAALSRAVAFGAAAVTLPGTRTPGPDDVAGITVTVTDDPDLELRLSD